MHHFTARVSFQNLLPAALLLTLACFPALADDDANARE
jgi:hypothetical protein